MVPGLHRLFKEVRPNESGNYRTYIELQPGRKLPLPYHWLDYELALAGNVLIDPQGAFIALYDESTSTGLCYVQAAESPYWMTVQPCLRENFFEENVPRLIQQAMSTSVVADEDARN